jgi:hypothetical protein
MIDDQEVISRIVKELKQLQELGVIEYYLGTIPEGEQFVVGVHGHVLKMDIDQAICFLAGSSAVAQATAKREGLIL